MSAARKEFARADIVKAWRGSTSETDMLLRLGMAKGNKVAIPRLCGEAGLEYPAPHWHAGRLSVPPPAPPPASAEQAQPAEIVQRDQTILRLSEDLKETKTLLKAAYKENNLVEEIRAVAHACFEPLPPVEPRPPRVGSGETVEDAILGWADWHGGEVIDFDVMQGYNAYDPTVCCRRAQYTVDHTLEILFDCHRGTTFEHLWVLDLGDSINGDHLPDQLATNAMGVFRCMRFVARLKALMLIELSAYLPVTYLSVPGNHGRRSIKQQWKDPTETADWLIAGMVSDLCAANARVEVVVPNAWTMGVTIRGWHHSLNHGYSAARGGYGGIPWYSFQRTDGKKTALESAHGKKVHYRWYGHIHQRAELPAMDGSGEQFIIGSLKGGDEYALEELSAYADPVQKLVGVHDKMGVTWRYPLDVKHADETPSRYEELVA